MSRRPRRSVATDIAMEPRARADDARRLSRRRPLDRSGAHASTLAAAFTAGCTRSAAPLSWLDAPLGDGPSLLHLDLHPDNVILSESRTDRDRLAERGARPGRRSMSPTPGSCLACSEPVTSGLPCELSRRAGRGAFTPRVPEPLPARLELAEALPAAGGVPACQPRASRAASTRRCRGFWRGRRRAAGRKRLQTRKHPVLASGVLSRHGGSPTLLCM